MAKPIQIAGLLRRTPIARAAANVLRAVLLDLLEKVPEARSGDSKKGIHDLRVAVKRFREAFRLFRPVMRKKTFRKHREWIEDLNDALGELRDRALLPHARQAGPAALPQRVAVPRRARRCPRRGFDGGDARDRHGRRSQGRAARVGAPLREGDPRPPRRVAQGVRARGRARASLGRGAARGRGAAALNRSTHGGAVVFKLTGEGPRYLLVEAAGTRDRWVFPKGHVEKRETAAVTALREVAEEAGVRARPIRRLRRVEQKQEGEWICIAYFLMAYAGRTTPLEKRRIRWLAFDEAIEALDLAKSRRVLRSADRLISVPLRHHIRGAAARLEIG